MPNTVTGNVPERMTTGRNMLIVKDPEKGAAVGNYRPITCLPFMWKTLTGIEEGLLPEEQKGCKRAPFYRRDDLKGEQNKDEESSDGVD